MFPECAELDEFRERKNCCDTKVKSAAGREFCYNDVVHEEAKFSQCTKLSSGATDFVSVFDCCDKLSGGSQTLSFDCKLHAMQSDCTGVFECKQLVFQRQQSFQIILAQRMIDKESNQNNGGLEVWQILVYFTLLPLIIIPVLVWAAKTKCGANPCFKSKTIQTTDISSAEITKGANQIDVTDSSMLGEQVQLSNSTKKRKRKIKVKRK